MRYWLLVFLLVSAAQAEPWFEFKDGDRVVFIGDTFIERDIQHNYLETMLTVRYPDRKVIFRNLGWSGDTVFVPSRSGSAPNKGFDLLVEAVKEQRPTVLFMAYGMNESFEGEAGLSRFVDGYKKLLEALELTKARFVLISPIAHEDLGRPLPDPTEHNKVLKLYSNAIRQIALARDTPYVDLFTKLKEHGEKSGKRLTEDGIHLNSYGYFLAAMFIEMDLGIAPEGEIPIKETKNGTIEFADRKLEQLRQLIRQKNVFFFDRYRPQNDMYIFWGRKHEQGRNAVEIPQFDKFIEAKEAEIAELKRAK